MTYIFSGLLSSDEITTSLTDDTEELVFRPINHTDIKTGVLFPSQAKTHIDSPNQTTINLVEKTRCYGIHNSVWVHYVCWGGCIDIVALAQVNHSKIDEMSYQIHEDIQLADLQHIFSTFGITVGNNGYFEPFVRGYWGEYGH